MMNRTNFELIAETFADNTEIVEFCQKEIAKLEKKADAKREASEANAALMTQIMGWLADEGPKAAAAEVAEGVGISVQKASYLLRTMFAEGMVIREDQGKRYVYSVA